MMMSVSGGPSFGQKFPINKVNKYISKTEYQQKQIERLTAQIGIINRDTDSLYKNGYDDAGRLTRDAREAIAYNESQLDTIRVTIDLLKEEVSRRLQK